MGRFLKLAETPGVYASHPLGGARMADEIGLGVTDDRCEVFGYEGLFCMDSSVIPTSFGVNPSLSISAVCERAAAKLVARAADFGLPAPPPGLQAPPAGRARRAAASSPGAERAAAPPSAATFCPSPWTTTDLEVPGPPAERPPEQ